MKPVINSQKGVLRINCVDCLDRTNNAMACVASVIMGDMIRGMGVDISDFYDVNRKAVTAELLKLVLEMFGRNGDKIAQQYAGSDAFHKAQIYRNDIDGQWQTLKQNITLIAVKRYISNTLLDAEKQRSLWLFLGEFTPVRDVKDPSPELWDLDPTTREVDALIHKNATDNYVNTGQEKVSLNNGRLKKMTLEDLKAFHPNETQNFDDYFEEEIKFDQPLVLVSSQDRLTKTEGQITQLKLTELLPENQTSIFESLTNMDSFVRAETTIWANFSSLPGKR